MKAEIRSSSTPIHQLRVLPGQREIHNPDRRIALPDLNGIRFEKVNKIIFLSAEGNYTNLYLNNEKKILVSKTLGEIERLIGLTSQFIRIHRSFTINLQYLERFIKGKTSYVVLEGAHQLHISNGRKQFFLHAIDNYFQLP